MTYNMIGEIRYNKENAERCKFLRMWQEYRLSDQISSLKSRELKVSVRFEVKANKSSIQVSIDQNTTISPAKNLCCK